MVRMNDPDFTPDFSPNWGNLDAKDTQRVMIAGFIIGAIMVIPFHAWLWDKPWPWAFGFPLGWLGIGLTYMSTFFHEIGHTVTAWFYGYFTLPTFDFAHGGGMSYWFGGQQIPILLLFYGLIAYGIYFFREARAIQIILAAILLFNLATAFNEDVRMSMIDFMGPASEPLVAGFLLWRALMNLAPRGGFERLLNAVFGFGMIFHAGVESYNLLNNQAYRTVYFEQKGQHGFGDFDKIADRFGFLGFKTVVIIWACLCGFCLVTPFVLARLFSGR